MDQQLAQSEVARLESIVRTGEGARAFPALCEAHRRSGRPEEAERVAREGLRRHPDQTAGRVALGLALLDLGRVEEARRELARVLDAVPDHAVARTALRQPEAEPPGEAELLAEIEESELEQAFAAAEADPEEMLDANGVAAAVVHAVESEPEEGEGAGIEAPFATRSMADLLERQGREDEAQRLRASLDVAEPEPPGPEPPPERERMVRTLENWLQNLRKGRR